MSQAVRRHLHCSYPQRALQGSQLLDWEAAQPYRLARARGALEQSSGHFLQAGRLVHVWKERVARHAEIWTGRRLAGEMARVGHAAIWSDRATVGPGMAQTGQVGMKRAIGRAMGSTAGPSWLACALQEAVAVVVGFGSRCRFY